MTIKEKIAILNVYKDINDRLVGQMKMVEDELVQCSENLKTSPTDWYYQNRESDLLDEVNALSFVIERINVLALSK